MISYPALTDTQEDRMKEDNQPSGGTPPPEYTEKIDKSNKDAELPAKRDGDLFTITTQPDVAEKKPSALVSPPAVVVRRRRAWSFSTAWKVVMTILFILVLTSVLFLATLYIKACGQCMAPRGNNEGYNRLPTRGYPLPPLPQLNSEAPLDNSIDGPSEALPHPLPPPPPPMPPCGGESMMGPFPPPPPLHPQFPMPPMPCFPPGGFPPFPPLPPPPMIFFPPPPPHFVEFLFPGLAPSQQSLIEKAIFEKGDGRIPPPPHMLPFLPMPFPAVEKSSKITTVNGDNDSSESQKNNVTATLVARRNRRLKFRKLKRRLNTTDCCDNLCT